MALAPIQSPAGQVCSGDHGMPTQVELVARYEDLISKLEETGKFKPVKQPCLDLLDFEAKVKASKNPVSEFAGVELPAPKGRMGAPQEVVYEVNIGGEPRLYLCSTNWDALKHPTTWYFLEPAPMY